MIACHGWNSWRRKISEQFKKNIFFTGIRSDRQRGGQHKRQIDPVTWRPANEELDEAGGDALVDQSALDVRCRENGNLTNFYA